MKLVPISGCQARGLGFPTQGGDIGRNPYRPALDQLIESGANTSRIRLAAHTQRILLNHAADVGKSRRQNWNPGETILEQLVGQAIVIAQRGPFDETEAIVGAAHQRHHLITWNGLGVVDVGGARLGRRGRCALAFQTACRAAVWGLVRSIADRGRRGGAAGAVSESPDGVRGPVGACGRSE